MQDWRTPLLLHLPPFTPAAVINVSLYSGQKTTAYNALVRRQLIFPLNRAECILNLSFHRGRKIKQMPHAKTHNAQKISPHSLYCMSAMLRCMCLLQVYSTYVSRILGKFHSVLNPMQCSHGPTTPEWESGLQVMALIIAIWATGQLPDSALPGGSTGSLVSDILGSL